MRGAVAQWWLGMSSWTVSMLHFYGILKPNPAAKQVGCFVRLGLGFLGSCCGVLRLVYSKRCLVLAPLCCRSNGVERQRHYFVCTAWCCPVLWVTFFCEKQLLCCSHR